MQPKRSNWWQRFKDWWKPTASLRAELEGRRTLIASLEQSLCLWDDQRELAAELLRQWLEVHEGIKRRRTARKTLELSLDMIDLARRTREALDGFLRRA